MATAQDIESTASEWLVRLETDASAEVRAEFDQWLESDPRHKAAYLRLERGWRRADRLKNLRPLDGAVNENVLDTFPQGQEPGHLEATTDAPVTVSRQRTPWFAAAAALAIVAIGPVMWFVGSHMGWQTYKTALGGLERISLEDGSTATLNTNTQLRVRMTKERRELILDRGEALFSVVHDPHRPFDVRAAETVVRAVGTSFSVRLSDQKQVDVIVKEGRVAIDPPDDSFNLKLAQPTVPLPQISTLGAGEAVRVHARKLEVQRIDTEDMTHKLLWTQGRLWFDRVTLAEAVAEFNRYNRRQLVIDDPAVAGLRIGGAFDANDLDSFVQALGTFGIKAEPTRTNQDDPDTEVIRLTGSPKH
jgi:transmembrane sensor